MIITGRDTPGPIPNPEVKPVGVDGSSSLWRARVDFAGAFLLEKSCGIE